MRPFPNPRVSLPEEIAHSNERFPVSKVDSPLHVINYSLLALPFYCGHIVRERRKKLDPVTLITEGCDQESDSIGGKTRKIVQIDHQHTGFDLHIEDIMSLVALSGKPGWK